jgi:hypothetical protein
MQPASRRRQLSQEDATGSAAGGGGPSCGSGAEAAAAAVLLAVREEICAREVALAPGLPGSDSRGYLSEAVNRRLRLLRSQAGALGWRGLVLVVPSLPPSLAGAPAQQRRSRRAAADSGLSGCCCRRTSWRAARGRRWTRRWRSSVGPQATAAPPGGTRRRPLGRRLQDALRPLGSTRARRAAGRRPHRLARPQQGGRGPGGAPRRRRRLQLRRALAAAQQWRWGRQAPARASRPRPPPRRPGSSGRASTALQGRRRPRPGPGSSRGRARCSCPTWPSGASSSRPSCRQR